MGEGSRWLTDLVLTILLGAALTVELSGLLLTASVRAICAAVYQLGGGGGWNHVSGWIAVGLFSVAMYGGLAFLLEDAKGHAVLPIGRRGESREAIEGDLTPQLAGIADEPGVRKSL